MERVSLCATPPRAMWLLEGWAVALMMIADITLKNGSVLLIEGLCAQIHVDSNSRYHFHVFFAFLFRKETYVKEKNAVSPRSHPAFQNTYALVYFVHIYEYIYAKI